MKRIVLANIDKWELSLVEEPKANWNDIYDPCAECVFEPCMCHHICTEIAGEYDIHWFHSYFKLRWNRGRKMVNARLMRGNHKQIPESEIKRRKEEREKEIYDILTKPKS